MISQASARPIYCSPRFNVAHSLFALTDDKEDSPASYLPSNGNFQSQVASDRALRQFVMRSGGSRGSNSCDSSLKKGKTIEELDLLAKADGVRPMNAKEEKIFRKALALIDRAGKRSKKEAKFFATMKLGFEALLKEKGQVVVVPGLKNKFETIRDRTRLAQNILDLDDGTPQGHHNAAVATAILLAHEWTHNNRGGKQKAHEPDREGELNPYLTGIEMGRLIKEMYLDDLKFAKPEHREAILQKIDDAEFWTEAHIEGGIGEGYEMNYDSRDIRHHVDHKRH